MSRATTLSVDLLAPFDRVWPFISDPRNLHLWTVDFAISEPQLKSNDIYIVLTPARTARIVRAMRQE